MSQTSNVDKIRPAWLVMSVQTILDTSPHLSLVRGDITNSNFLPRKFFEMPVITKGFQCVREGDLVRLTYFTTKSQLDSYWAKKSAGFIDIGLRYERLEDEGWEKIYEDWSENLARG